MKLYIEKFIYLSLIILNLFINKTDAIDTKSLLVICGLVNGTEAIKKPPPGCTALASPTYNPTFVANINLIKGKLPLMLVDDSTTYRDWLRIVTEDPSLYMDNLVLNGVDIIAFDNMYSDTLTSLDNTFTKNLINFIVKAKVKRPAMLFGLLVPHFAHVAKNSLNFKLLSNDIDFIIIKYEIIEECEHKNHQGSMEDMHTKDHIAYMVEQLTEAGMNKTKLLFSLSLNVRGVRKGQEPVDMSFTRLCSVKMSKKRKYCFESVDDLFYKSRYRIEQAMAGIYVVDLENDDIEGKCECTLSNDPSVFFPGLRIIVGASTETDRSVDSYQCSSGEFPKIIH